MYLGTDPSQNVLPSPLLPSGWSGPRRVATKCFRCVPYTHRVCRLCVVLAQKWWGGHVRLGGGGAPSISVSARSSQYQPVFCLLGSINPYQPDPASTGFCLFLSILPMVSQGWGPVAGPSRWGGVGVGVTYLPDPSLRGLHLGRLYPVCLPATTVVPLGLDS